MSVPPHARLSALRDNASRDDQRVRAVLGPTNTGKTHLAIERLCAHSSGAIGFPLRLLAREVYDRVCAIKGENRVALITGEERIEPRDARWLLCTAEAMPLSGSPLAGSSNEKFRDLAFVALDEAQLAADRERGHVFTDRLLNARGREETMILGSATLEPMIKALIPEAEVVTRPRFSTLSHAGIAMLACPNAAPWSPSRSSRFTRDGRRKRRLTPSEMAQIAGTRRAASARWHLWHAVGHERGAARRTARIHR